MADKSRFPAKPNRPIYQSHSPTPPSNRRTFCCSAIFALLSLVLLAAIACGVFYAIYRPHRPTFSISSLRLSAINTTSRLYITVTARNPNRRIAFHYDQISVSISSNGVGIGEGSFPGFAHSAKNTTVMSSSAATSSHLKSSTVPMEILMDTRAFVEVGKLKTKKFRMKVYCDGIRIAEPKGEKVDASCEVKLRMKIWKWTI